MRVDQRLHGRVLLLLLLLRQGGNGGESLGDQVLQREDVLLLLFMRHLAPVLKLRHLSEYTSNVLLKRRRCHLDIAGVPRSHLLALRGSDGSILQQRSQHLHLMLKDLLLLLLHLHVHLLLLLLLANGLHVTILRSAGSEGHRRR